MRRRRATTTATPTGMEEAQAAISLLRRAGYGGEDGTHVAARSTALRSDYAGEIQSLAAHLGANRAVLLPETHRCRAAGAREAEARGSPSS